MRWHPTEAPPNVGTPGEVSPSDSIRTCRKQTAPLGTTSQGRATPTEKSTLKPHGGQADLTRKEGEWDDEDLESENVSKRAKVEESSTSHTSLLATVEWSRRPASAEGSCADSLSDSSSASSLSNHELAAILDRLNPIRAWDSSFIAEHTSSEELLRFLGYGDEDVEFLND